MKKEREVKVGILGFDQQSNSGIITLIDPHSDKVIPMVAGAWETIAVFHQLNHQNFLRPHTFDLIKSVLDGFDAEVIKILVDDFKNDSYFAKIFLKSKSRKITLDALPSNAIAIAVRTGAPIFVNEAVFERLAVKMDWSKKEKRKSDAYSQKIEDWLDKIKPADFES